MPEKTKRRFRLLRVPFKKDARGRPRNYAQMFHVKHWPTPALSLRHRLRLSIARTHRSCWGIARETVSYTHLDVYKRQGIRGSLSKAFVRHGLLAFVSGGRRAAHELFSYGYCTGDGVPLDDFVESNTSGEEKPGDGSPAIGKFIQG